ncbi:MAG: exonuclease SbcCD subunit D [Chloroflexota bacterium]
MSIRVLHFADLHVGMENYGKVDPETGISSRIRDFLDRLDEVIAYAFDHDADLVLFAGDAFKTRDPDPTQQREFARRIKHLADKVPVFMLVGNHDIPGMASRATSIDIFRTLEVPNIIVGRTISSQVIQTKRGPIFLGWVPFPVRGRLLAQEDHKGASVEQLDKAVEALVIGEMTDLAALAADQPMPRVLAGHFSVGGATFGSERSVMLGRDLVVPKSSLADPVWDYVALGHIHKHQNLTTPSPALPRSELHRTGEGDSPPIVYSGSLERIDFGEEVEDKGFCWVELDRGKTIWQFVKVSARPFVTIRVDARDSDDPTADVIKKIEGRSLKGAIVRVGVQLREAQAAGLREREIERALREAEVSSIAAIAKDVERETRAALGGASPETLTPAQLVQRYFQAKGKSSEEAARYAQAAESLFSAE